MVVSNKNLQTSRGPPIFRCELLVLGRVFEKKMWRQGSNYPDVRIFFGLWFAPWERWNGPFGSMEVLWLNGDRNGRIYIYVCKYICILYIYTHILCIYIYIMSKTNTSHLENGWLDYDNLLLGREGIYICNNHRTLLGGSSQDLGYVVWITPIYKPWNSAMIFTGPVPNPGSWEQKRSQWFGSPLNLSGMILQVKLLDTKHQLFPSHRIHVWYIYLHLP